MTVLWQRLTQINSVAAPAPKIQLDYVSEDRIDVRFKRTQR